jgi:gliding motility-associated-like protein
MLFFSGTCNGPITTYGCYEHIYPYSGTGQPIISVISASGLIPGNSYYLMIDGYNGDNCTFTIAANTGVNVLNISPAAPAICEGSSVNLTATGGNGTFSWSPASNLNTTAGATVTATPPGTTTYTVTSTTPAGCPITKDVTVTVNTLPAAPTASVTAQPDCATPTGTITITAPIGAGFEYSVNGTAYQASPVFTGLTPNITYHITVRNISTGCISPEITLTIGPPAPNPVAPTAAATAQPTCTNPTGTITVTAPTGPGLLYSIGGPYQASPVFTGLTQNVYNVNVQNGPGCTSPGTSVTINAAPAPPTAPTVNVTPPNCVAAGGSATVTSPVGSAFQYSLNGGSYQTSPIFTGLMQGTTNTITVQNTAGCTSLASSFFVPVICLSSANPTVTTIFPTCTSQVGTITATSPLGSDIIYIIYNTTTTGIVVVAGPQTSPVFADLPLGSYYLVAQNTTTSCCRATQINFFLPASPNQPTGVVTQPGCTVQTGSITITSPTGTDLQYNINGGPYQVSPIFTGLTQNAYNVTVQNAAGCTSPITVLTVNAAPTAPVAPTATITAQPTCTNPTGTITVTAPTGPGLQYSINGGLYQASPVFTGLTQNVYNVTVQNGPGCTSPGTSVTINAVPTPPAAPAASVTTQPTCTIPTGVITITAPVGMGLEYSIDGINYQASPVFPAVNPNSYNVTVRNDDCISAATILTVGGAPGQAPGPIVGTVHPGCNQLTGTIIITPPAGINLEYSINGTFYQASPTFNNVAPGNYTITVRNTVTGCVSIGTTTTVNPPPALPSAPTGSVTSLPDCNNSGGTITLTSPLGADYEYSSNGGTSYQSSPVFTNLPPLSYGITVRNTVSGCISQPLMLTVAAGPVRPDPPTLTTIQPDCSGNPGSITVTAPLGAGLQYSMNGSAYQSSTTFSNLTEALYLIKVKDATGCESFATPAIILQSAGLPPKPVIVQVQPVCPQLTGTITVTSPVAGNIEYSLNGSAYQSSNIFTNVAGGNYNVTARFTGTPCVSAATAANIKGLTPDQCLVPANGDIYFPSAFTPNGDMLNDGFGPGPGSNLSAVSNYTLMIFNRYGELVFKAIDPLLQWDGIFKGKMLANNTFTWVSSYRYGTRPLQIKKGTVTVIR